MLLVVMVMLTLVVHMRWRVAVVLLRLLRMLLRSARVHRAHGGRAAGRSRGGVAHTGMRVRVLVVLVWWLMTIHGRARPAVLAGRGRRGRHARVPVA